MTLSTRALHLSGVLLIAVLAVKCAEQPAGDGVLPASPSSVPVSPSGAALGPGASYDASGMWRFVVADAGGNVVDTFDTNVSQDGNGNLSFLDGEGVLITLERLGTGVILTYRQSVISDEGDCDVRIQSTVRLDTRTNTITARLRLKSLCSNERQGLVVTGTKLS